MCQDAARQEGFKLVFDELRHAGTGGLFGLGKKALGVLPQQAVQRALLGAVALVVDRGASASAIGGTSTPSAPAAAPKPYGSVHAPSGAARPRKPKTLIHRRAISASHARRTRRWVSRVDRRMRCPLSALLTTPTQVLFQSGVGK